MPLVLLFYALARTWYLLQMILYVQGIHPGPPGMELAQGLALGVQGANKAMIMDITKTYYAALLKHGPPCPAAASAS